MPAPLGLVVNGTIGLVSSRQLLAAQGKYFVVTNPTNGTGIVAAVVTSASATANGLFLVRNTNLIGGANIQLDYLKLMLSGTAPTATTVMNFDMWSETGLVVGTGNVATRTPVQINQAAGFTQNTGAIVQSFAAGQITIPAAVGTRQFVGRSQLPTSLGITGDVYTVLFGSDTPALGSTAGTAVRATQAANLVAQAVPMIIPPQTSGWINMWWLTQATNAGTFEFELAYAEL